MNKLIKTCISFFSFASLNCSAGGVVITGNAVGDLVIDKAPPRLNKERLVLRKWEIDENGQSFEHLKVKVDNNQVNAEIYEGIIWRISVDEGTLKTRDGIKVGDRVSFLLRKNPTVKPEIGPGPSLVFIPTTPCGISYVTDARLSDHVALPLNSASAATFAKAAHVTTILVVGCETR